MKQIILQKDEKRLIPILLGNSNLRHSGDERSEDTRIDSGQARMTGAKLEIILAGENSEIEVVGLVLGKKTDEKALEVYITHVGKNTKSKVNVRAVLRNKSTFSFRGNVKIEKGAKGADAYLRSDALLFDEAKMGDDTPALEILERDVKAGHAATIGKVDEIMLFYLMSRGITRVQAEKLLIQGFTQPILDQIRAGKPSFAIHFAEASRIKKASKGKEVIKMSKVKVAKKSDISKGKVIPVRVGGEEVAIYHTKNDEFYATSDICTHEDCNMSHEGGKLEGYEVECDCHGSKFDIRTGKVLLPPAMEDLKTYKVTTEGEDILVED